MQSGFNTRKFSARNPSYSSYVDLNGSSDYISTPNSTFNAITGDVDFRTKVSLDDVNGAYIDTFFSSETTILLERLSSSEVIRAYWSDGVTIALAQANDFPPWFDGVEIWIRLTIDVSAGTASFYSSTDYDPSDESGTWTLIGSANRDSGEPLSGIAAATTPYLLGRYDIDFFAGKVYYAELRDGIDGPIVAKFNASEYREYGNTFYNIPGEQDWTNNGGIYVPA